MNNKDKFQYIIDNFSVGDTIYIAENPEEKCNTPDGSGLYKICRIDIEDPRRPIKIKKQEWPLIEFLTPDFDINPYYKVRNLP